MWLPLLGYSLNHSDNSCVTACYIRRESKLWNIKEQFGRGLNLAATSALGHVTAALASAVPELDCTPINKLTDHMRSFVFDGAVRPSYIRIGNGCVVTSSLVVDRQILRLPINANVPIQKHRILCRKIGIWATVRSKVKRKPAANQN